MARQLEARLAELREEREAQDERLEQCQYQLERRDDLRRRADAVEVGTLSRLATGLKKQLAEAGAVAAERIRSLESELAAAQKSHADEAAR